MPPLLKQPRKLFWYLITLHLLLWSLLPSLLSHGLAMDPTEAAMWSQHLAWGYPRDPWGIAWFSRLALWISHGHDWGIYLFAQLCMIGTFWAIWRLSNQVLSSPYYALIAVAMLEGIQYYNLSAIDLNDNVLETLFWALTCYYSYLAVKHPHKLTPWLITGVFAGLAIMTKYVAVILLLSLISFTLFIPRAKRVYRCYGFYFAIAITVLICLPHIFWLFQNNFITVMYSHDKVAAAARFHSPWYFLGEQLLNVLGALVILSIASLRNKQRVLIHKEAIENFEKCFVGFITLGPIIVVLVLASLMDWDLRSSWGMPLLCTSSLFILTYFRPTISVTTIKNLIIATLLFILIEIAAFVYPTFKTNFENTETAPYANLAIQVNTLWREQFHTPLRVAAGPRRTVIYVSHYAPDKPKAVIGFSFKASTWIEPEEFVKYGGVLVQPVSDNASSQHFPEKILKEFSVMKTTTVQAPWKNSSKDHPPAKWLVGLVAPGKE